MNRTKRSRLSRWIGALTLASALNIGAFVWNARAAGIPSAEPLFYGGTLEESGVLPTGQVPIGLQLFAVGSSTPLCSVASAPVDVVRGEFRLNAAACIDAVKGNADVEVELSVRGVAMPREKVGAVPYAVEADRSRVTDLALSVAADTIGAQSITDGSVGAAEVAAGAIGADELANGAVTRAKAPFAPRITLNDGALTTNNLSVYTASILTSGYGIFLGITVVAHDFPAGTFSAPPVCVLSNGANANLAVAAAVESVTASRVQFVAYDSVNTAGLNGEPFRTNLVCTGPG